MIHAYEEKYATRNPAMVLKALDYHNDINFSEPIEMLDGEYDWKDIEKVIGDMTLNPDNLFDSKLVTKQGREWLPIKGKNRGLRGGLICVIYIPQLYFCYLPMSHF